MFAFHEVRGRVAVAFTDRHGPSGGALNLALPGSPPAAVPGASPVEGLLAVGAAFAEGGPVVGMNQVHGATVAVVDDAYDGSEIVADALVTSRSDLTLLVRVADCVPLLLADVERGVTAAVHVGRAGLAAGVVPSAVAVLRSLGAGQVEAWVGPHVCGRCYEGPAAMREEVGSVVPEARSETSWGTPALDLGRGVRTQLAALGVDAERWHEVERCTIEDDDLWSHRRQGERAGRLGGLVRVLP